MNTPETINLELELISQVLLGLLCVSYLFSLKTF